MLGKLFSTAASSLTPRAGSSSPSRAPAALDSVLEDIHTRNLLFPDGEALSQYQHDQVFPFTTMAATTTATATAAATTATAATSAAAPLPTSTFDLNNDVDLDLRDVRVVILQEATATQPATLLFDSHPLGPPSRRLSLSEPRTTGAFDRRPSAYETDGQRTAREYREEMAAVASCVFGSSDVMAFKGTGTKVHLMPAGQSFTTDPHVTPSKKVLVTRIFPVALPGRKPRHTRTPMYAIALVVPLAAWAALAAADDANTTSCYANIHNQHNIAADDGLDALTQHWDIVRRALSQLQAGVAASVLNLLRLADAASPDPPPKAGAKLVQLAGHALSGLPAVASAVDDARQRIVSGLTTRAVVTRQGRWSVWRDEARWLCRWAGAARADERFLYRLLTSFLACHTEWLAALAPQPYRRRYAQQHRGPRDEDGHIAARTVIVAHDKMAARRLLFLLASFLPPSSRPHAPGARMYRPVTAASPSPPSSVPPSLRDESLRRRLSRRPAAHIRTLSFPSPAAAAAAPPRRPALVADGGPKTALLPMPADGASRKSSAAITATVTPAATVPYFSTRRTMRGGGLRRPGSSGSLAADDLFKTLKRVDSADHHSSASSDSRGYSRWGSVISGFWSGAMRRRESTNSTDVTPPSPESLEIGPPLPKSAERRNGSLAEMVEAARRDGGESVDPVTDATSAAITYAIPSSQPMTMTTTTTTVPRAPYTSREPRLAHAASTYGSPVKASINEDDGVIEIDVPLPDYITSSFGSAFSSPSSSGYLSNHGIGHGFEGFEHYPRVGPDADAPLNVGGWLPRYHPDFILQAIPAQERLEEDIRASLRAEPTPPLSPAHREEKALWVDISSALIADAARFTIRRIRYRRHLMVTVPNSAEQQQHSPATRSQSLYGYPSIYQQSGFTYSVIDEAFDEDVVLGIDDTLILAVEAVIAQPSTLLSPSGPPPFPFSSNPATRASSPRPAPYHYSPRRDREGSDSTAIPIPHSQPAEPDSAVSRPSRSVEARHRPHVHVSEALLDVPRAECKKVLLGALEDVARQVADLAMDDALASHRSARERESPLREGVRTWLKAVEDWA